MRHVIIGSGAAGVAAAKTLREQQSQDEILILSADEAVYSRCMLHQFISGERQVEALSFIPDGFFEQYQIEFRPGVTVTKIDTVNQCVVFDGGSESYDRLLIATGAKSFFPPIDGLASATNVYGLRDLSDARAISERAKQANNIVIIGAGLVGLDAAYGLLEMGKAPTVVDLADSILSANLDVHAAGIYQKKFTEAGCIFHLGAKVRGVLCDTFSAVSSVTLDNGDSLPCDLLIVAAGVRPTFDFLEGSGIETARGIMVNAYMATTAQNVYAAGDITGLSESWPSAIAQGEIAAMNMLGIETPHPDTFLPQNTIHFFGIPSLSLGRFIAGDGDTEDSREDRRRYQKVILRDGIPVGVILQGDISRSGFWQQLIQNKINVASIPKSIWKISFADSYHVDENGEYQWSL